MKQLSFGKNPQHRVIPQYCHKLLSNSISLLHSHEITQGTGSLLNRFSQPFYPWKPLKRLCRYCKLSVTKCGPVGSHTHRYKWVLGSCNIYIFKPIDPSSPTVIVTCTHYLSGTYPIAGLSGAYTTSAYNTRTYRGSSGVPPQSQRSQRYTYIIATYLAFWLVFFATV